MKQYQYLLDTNVFIEAYHRYYPENIVPSFNPLLHLYS